MCNTFSIIIFKNVLSHVLIAKIFFMQYRSMVQLQGLKQQALLLHTDHGFSHCMERQMPVCLQTSNALLFGSYSVLDHRESKHYAWLLGIETSDFFIYLFSMLQATCNVNTLHSKQIFTFTLIINVHHRIKLRRPLIPTHECHLCLSPVRYWALIHQAVLTGLPWDCFGSHSCSLSLYRMARCAYHRLSDNCVCLLVLYPNTCASVHGPDTVNPFNERCCI